MTSDDNQEPPAQRRGRPQNPPLTIDLNANAPEASLAGAEAPAPPTDGPPPEPMTAEIASPAGAGDARPASDSPQAAPPEAAAAPSETRNEPALPRPSAPSPARPPRSGRVGYALALLLGAAVTVAVVIAIAASGILPFPGKATADAAAAKADAVAAKVDALTARVAALESRPSPAAVDTSGLAMRIGTLESAGKAADDRIGKVETALAAKPEARSADMDQVLDDLMARLERVETAVAKSGNLTPPASLSDLAARVAALENSTGAMAQRLAALQAHPPGASESEKAGRALAIDSLRRAAEAGTPFAGSLAMLQALGLDETDIAALRPLAEKGAPPKAELAGSFPEVADRILAASAAVDPHAGFFDRLAGFARGLVTVRPTTPIPGDTPDAIVSRMQAAIDHGDLAQALAERNALPENAKAVSAGWAQGAGDRLAVDRLVEKLSRAAGAAAGAAD